MGQEQSACFQRATLRHDSSPSDRSRSLWRRGTAARRKSAVFQLRCKWHEYISALRLVLMALGCGLLLGCATQGAQSPDPHWITLIDGEKGLENFTRIRDANWHPENGAIVADRGRGHLLSKQAFGDFQLRVEFWSDPTTDSGVFIRASHLERFAGTSYEVQINDGRSDGYGTGSIVGVAKVSPRLRAGGQWNTYLITAKGSHLVVELNGVKTVDVENSKFTHGPFTLQFGDKGPIKFRKVQIRAL